MVERLPKLPACQNCGTETGSNFCPDCGQDCRNHTVSVKLLFHDFIDDVFTFDSRFFRSFIPLLFKPGTLTSEYVHGRRIQYIPPLRLYIITSLLFFFLVSLQVQRQMTDDSGQGRNVSRAEADSLLVTSAFAQLDSLGLSANDDGSLERVLARLADQTDSTSSDDGIIHFSTFNRPSKDLDAETFVAGLLKLVPKSMFFLLPVFAAVLAVIYWRSHRKFIEHLVFSLHYHAFLFLLFAIALIVDQNAFHITVFFGMQVYLFFALRRIYTQGWWKTGLKFFLLTGTYNAILFTLLVIVAVSTAQLMELRETHPMLVQWILN